MHTNETCQQYAARYAAASEERRRQEHAGTDAATQALLAATTKRCPSCNTAIERTAGCDHMICTVCWHHFCWLCGAPYDGEQGIRGRNGNAAHRKGCDHHRDHVERAEKGPAPRLPAPGNAAPQGAAPARADGSDEEMTDADSALDAALEDEDDVYDDVE